LAYEFTKNAISSRELSCGFLLLIAGLFIVILYRLRHRQSDEKNKIPLGGAPTAKLAKSIKILQVAVVVLPVLLIFGLLQTEGEPLAPRLVGVAINLCFTFWFITLLRRAKRVAKTRTERQE
jgi:hypothetical protein